MTESGKPAQPGQAYAWLTVILFLALYILAQIDRNIINLVVEPLREEFQLSTGQAGLLLGPAFGVSYALSTFPLAWLADRSSRRLVVFLGVMVWSAAALGSGFVTTFPQLFAMRMLVGVGEAALLPAAYVIISHLFAQTRLATALSVLALGSSGGIAIAYGMGGWLVQNAQAIAGRGFLEGGAPWRVVLVITALPSFVLGLLLWFVPEPRRTARDSDTERRSSSLLSFIRQRPRAIAALVIGFSCSAICNSALVAWLPTYMQTRFDWSLAKVGAALGAIILILATIGKLGSGVIVDRMFAAGREDAHARYLLITLLIGAPPAAASFFVSDGWIFLGLIGCWFLFAFPIMGYGSALVQLVTPAALRSQMSAVFLLAINLLAAMLGPPLAGWFSEALPGHKPALGPALTATILLWIPLGLILLWQGLGPLGAAVRANREPQGCT